MAVNVTSRQGRWIEVYPRRWRRRTTPAHEAAEITADRPWLVSWDAREMVAVAGDAAAAHFYRSIQRGEAAHTGRRRDPDKGTDPRRMIRSGKYLESLSRSKVSGSEVRAQCRISGAPGPVIRTPHGGQSRLYDFALQREAERGELYFRVMGLTDKAIGRGLRQYVEDHAAGRHPPISLSRRKASEIVRTGYARGWAAGW